jgi:hypothetical protein
MQRIFGVAIVPLVDDFVKEGSKCLITFFVSSDAALKEKSNGLLTLHSKLVLQSQHIVFKLAGTMLVSGEVNE